VNDWMRTTMDTKGLRDIDELFEATERLEAEIIERRKAEELLREANERFSRMIENAHDAVVSIDEAGNVIAWNTCAEQIFGWSAQEAMGRKLAELIIPEEFRGRPVWRHVDRVPAASCRLRVREGGCSSRWLAERR